jgi:hypothetical protein
MTLLRTTCVSSFSKRWATKLTELERWISVERRKWSPPDFEAAAIVAAVGLLFAVLFHLQDLSSIRLDVLFVGFSFGAFCGFALLPAIDPNKWNQRPLICSLLGSVLSGAFAAYLNYSPTVVSVFAFAGACLGYLAPRWVNWI